MVNQDVYKSLIASLHCYERRVDGSTRNNWLNLNWLTAIQRLLFNEARDQ